MTKTELEKSIDALPFQVPSGVLTWPESGNAYYLSDGPVRADLWARLRQQHPRSGLWPVFLQGHERDPEYPWLSSDSTYYCTEPPEPDAAEAVLRRQWDLLAGIGALSPRLHSQFTRRTEPFNGTWPGLAARSTFTEAPGAVADEVAGGLIQDADTRLGLIQVDRSADIPMAVEWWASDAIDTGSAVAVLRSWEDRFGVRLIQFGYDSLELSVAAPPTTRAAAERVAVEHLAFCEENIEHGRGALAGYAEELIGAQQWSFCWERAEPDWLDEDLDREMDREMNGDLDGDLDDEWHPLNEG